MKIKRFENILLVSDLDGTLLDSKQKISKENLEAITKFKKLGGKFTIATGRMEKSVQPFIDLLNIDIPVILYNGAVIYDPKSTRVLEGKFLEGYVKLIEAFQTLATKVDLGLLVYQMGNVYTIERNTIIQEYEEKDQVLCEIITDEIFNEPITKVLLISPNTETLSRCEEVIHLYDFTCNLVYSENNYLEILPKTASKGSALLQLQEYLNYKGKLKTICIGDNLNDISMLETAHKGFIVENCHSSMKQSNFIMGAHHENNAIADVIYNHIFSEKEEEFLT
ncbi:Cof-type HAD-IIB family hydrolase [Oceanobacillus caeni]|uniref:Cof-type HAD-IIB family hydrolase n=2 Tax=Bacillales TaxID=1385 RepID=UPI001443D3AC|nr:MULTISPECIES: Cof-type HAD-IIB family hydrolase [Bacillaceae]MBU8789381.1 Cof-type HAD-IIB family hydrolase [Oceanobacillus caeni]MCR1832835.1 Cof-type HAD-IIB family hydrolase [Oceanobacillus caeni]